MREKQNRLNRARGDSSRGGNSTLLCKLTGRHGGTGLCKFVSFLFKQAASLHTVPSQISRRFLSSSQGILILFSIPSFPSRGISDYAETDWGIEFAPRTTPRAATATRSLTHSRMHSHAHLVESVRDTKSAVSHVRKPPRGSLPPFLSLPFSLSTPAPRGRPRDFAVSPSQ